MYLWVKSLHVIFMVTWFAALFYLPRLFVYHAAAADDPAGCERFKVMERKLYYGIMGPGALATLVFGLWMIWMLGLPAFKVMHWLHVKLALVAVLGVYHLYLGRILRAFKEDRNERSHVFYRWINEFPVLILFPVVILAIVKPVFA